MGERATIDQDYLYDIADAIREKRGVTTRFMPAEMKPAILSIPTGAQRLYIVDPEALDNINNHGSALYTYTLPYFSKINNDVNTSNSVVKCNEMQSFDGRNVICLFRGGQEIGGAKINIRIPSGIYQKLYVNVMVTAYETAQPLAYLQLSTSMSLSSNGLGDDVIKNIILVSWAKTTEQINGQSGVKINSTDPLLLSAQTVEIDISAITSDFYFGFWNKDRNIAIRSVYAE